VDKRTLDDGTVIVGFELPEAVAATTVSVVGDFNGWTAQVHPLDRVDGGFRAEIALPAGDRLRFRYLLDGGRWENDWAADDYVPNEFGQDDSVVDLTNPRGLQLPALTDAAPSDAPAEQAEAEPEATEAGPDATDAGEPAREPGRLRRWWRRLVARRPRRKGSADATPDADAQADVDPVAAEVPESELVAAG